MVPLKPDVRGQGASKRTTIGATFCHEWTSFAHRVRERPEMLASSATNQGGPLLASNPRSIGGR